MLELQKNVFSICNIHSVSEANPRFPRKAWSFFFQHYILSNQTTSGNAICHISSDYMKMLLISQTSLVPCVTLCLSMLLLAWKDLSFSDWPTFLILQVLSQMSPHRVGNNLSCASTGILSQYSGIVTYLCTCLSHTRECEILQNRENICLVNLSISSRMWSVHHLRQVFNKCGVNQCKNEEKKSKQTDE